MKLTKNEAALETYRSTRQRLVALQSQIENSKLPVVSEMLGPLGDDEIQRLSDAIDRIVGLLETCEENVMDEMSENEGAK